MEYCALGIQYFEKVLTNSLSVCSDDGSDDEDLSESQQALFKKMNKQIKKEKHEQEENVRRSKSFADIGYDDFDFFDDLDMPMEDFGVNEEKAKPKIKTFEDITSEEDFSIGNY